MKSIIFCAILMLFSVACEKTFDREIKEFEFDSRILDGYFVTSLAFDSEGTAWIGTFKQGLIKYSEGETVLFNSANSLIPDSGVIYDIAADSKDHIWIGCEGLIRFDGSTFVHYNSENSDIPEDFVQSIDIDSRDNVWFSSSRFRQGGVVKYNGAGFDVYTPDNSDLPVNSVKDVAIDKNDNVWIALSETVNETYLVRISGNNWNIYTGDDLGFSPYYIGNILIDNRNELWASIDYSLSSIYRHKGPRMFRFDGKNCIPIDNDSIADLRIIYADRDNNIWWAEIRKFGIFDGHRWIVDEVTLKDESIFAICQAGDGKIWIGTGDGVFIMDSDMR